MIERLRELWNQPLDGRARPAVIAASVALLLACAAITLTIASGREDAERTPPPAAAGEPADAAREQLSAPGGRPSASLSSGDVENARRASRAFLAGYLPYTYGRGSAARIEAATDALRAELARTPPRVPPRVRAMRPRLVSASSELHGDGLETVALVADGQRSYSISLFLERDRERGWRVAAVGG